MLVSAFHCLCYFVSSIVIDPHCYFPLCTCITEAAKAEEEEDEEDGDDDNMDDFETDDEDNEENPDETDESTLRKLAAQVCLLNP